VPRVRVRTLMIAVGLVALLLWGAMMGAKSYDCYRRAREYGVQERGWREIASRNDSPGMEQFHSECVQYFRRRKGTEEIDQSISSVPFLDPRSRTKRRNQ